MNEAYEVELTQIKTTFAASPIDIILGVERQTTLKVDTHENIQGFTDIEWQVIYARALIDDCWHILPQTLYDEVDDEHGDLIGDKLWSLTQTLN